MKAFRSALIRSALFVPAQREGWVEKAVAAGPDAVILDLEDSVPAAEKRAGRERLTASLSTLADAGVVALVRPNDWGTDETEADLASCVREGLSALVLPKVGSLRELERYDAAVGELERARGLEAGQVELIVTLETAAGYLAAAELARAPRVSGLFAAIGKGADVQRELGYAPTASGLETLYYRSHAVLAARAARLPHVLVGPWQEIRDLDGLERGAAFNRTLGFSGEVLIHPGGVPIVNKLYAPSREELDYHVGLIAAYEAAAAGGAGAADYRGDHVDAAHYRTSLELVARARRLGLLDDEGG